jgi:uncharacterized alkaline shock family protein YloU
LAAGRDDPAPTGSYYVTAHRSPPFGVRRGEDKPVTTPSGSTTTDSSSATAIKPASPGAGGQLETRQGKITIADTVVSKIAGMAAREVGGVFQLGGGAARAFGAIRERIPGSGGPNIAQGVAVEVGETQAAVDIDVVVEYGARITDLAAGIRRNVITNLERMTGLEVVEVNVAVNDIHLPTDEPSEAEHRVQ